MKVTSLLKIHVIKVALKPKIQAKFDKSDQIFVQLEEEFMDIMQQNHKYAKHTEE